MNIKIMQQHQQQPSKKPPVPGPVLRPSGSLLSTTYFCIGPQPQNFCLQLALEGQQSWHCVSQLIKITLIFSKFIDQFINL